MATPLQTAVPTPNRELLLLLWIVGLVICLPIVGMYRESTAHSDSPLVWTGTMAVLAVIAPVAGPIVLWILYTAVVVGKSP